VNDLYEDDRWDLMGGDPPETQADLDALAESVSFDAWVDEMVAQDG
jgi:hypothetical protein